MCTSISDQIGISKCWFFKRGETQGKTSKSKGDKQKQTQSTYDVDARTLNPGHICGRRLLSPQRHPCCPAVCMEQWSSLSLKILAYNSSLNLFPARFICTIMASLTFPRSIGLFINRLFNSNYDSRTGFANILSVLFCFFFQLSIIALVARVETIELAPAS